MYLVSGSTLKIKTVPSAADDTLCITGVAPSILQTAEMGEPKYLIFITNLLQNTHQLIIKYLFIILHFCKGDAERVRCVCDGPYVLCTDCMCCGGPLHPSVHTHTGRYCAKMS